MAQTLDLTFIQGDDFKAVVTAKDSAGSVINLSGYGVAGKVRNRYSDSTHLFDLNPSIATAASGTINIDVAATGTASMPVTEAVYDVEIYIGSQVTRLLEGNVKILPQVL
jgi:hypothetical protein